MDQDAAASPVSVTVNDTDLECKPIIPTVAKDGRSGSSSRQSTPRTSSAGQPTEWREDVASWSLVAQRAVRKDSLARFYEHQAEAIESYLKLDEEQRKHHLAQSAASGAESQGTAAALAQANREQDLREARIANLAIRLSLALNICMCFLKGYAMAISGSLVVATSLTDSALDLLSGSILVVVGYLRHHADPDVYPTGTHRFESLGTLIFSCIMCLASVKLIEACTEQILAGDAGYDQDPIFFVGAVIIVKLIAWLLCRRIASTSVAVEALADDHRNDCFSNAIGVVAVYFAANYWALIDPIVALITSAAIMLLWSRSAYLQVQALSGRCAPKEVLNALTLLARNHDSRVVAVDTVRAVTAGDGFLVEIDLILPPTMTLKEAHDIGEGFQLFLESLRSLSIARAYVHLDYDSAHNPWCHQ